MTTPVLEGKASFALRAHNPDVLTCIANLSNDEVFTPPELAGQMLDTVADAWADANGGEIIWQNPDVTFLDPFTKSGVFLREITARLTEGLADKIPDLQERVDHILTKQVYGIGITQLTALLARRSVYCSKDATGPHSVARSFDRDWGNIWFERTEHTWAGDRCGYCGAGKASYGRGDAFETHAYAFIHTTNPRAMLARMFGADVQFDVIIGNPPYQLNDGGGSGTSAGPLYHRFVAQAKRMDPRLVCMVTPARWFSGGKGLDDFRESMLEDDRLRVIEDYPDSNDVFPGTQIKGGIAFWLWDRDSPGDVRVSTHDKGEVVSIATRPLVEPGTDVFIRYNEALPILRKVARREHGGETQTLFPPARKRFSELVSVRRPFGLESSVRGSDAGDVLLYQAGGTARIERAKVSRGVDLIDAWKVFIAFLASGSDAFPHVILGKPLVGVPGSVSTETYLAIGPFESEAECRSVVSYISTRFFRFLVLQKKPSQNATKKVYEFVPSQDFSRPWTDADLYEKYGITDEEIEFIESMVRPMEAADVDA
ncbi:Eco57I restriction-modification methylase domain-containing protein [Microbacterium sp. NPDC077644]|uniref:Eco57I restriction-modification methylase domain-containing protein n=1 Tax=Microbacterium sp. NPDC077644 TaxID=3155055 RepID=UPI00344ED362